MNVDIKKLEAYLFAEGDAVSKKKLVKVFNASIEQIQQAINSLSKQLEGRGIVLVQTDEAVALRTSPDVFEFLQEIYEKDTKEELGSAALEVFAILLYNGEASKTQIDYIRGVNSSTSLKNLMIRGLVERKKEKGRTFYRVTPDALSYLGVKTVDELPNLSKVKEKLQELQEQE